MGIEQLSATQQAFPINEAATFLTSRRGFLSTLGLTAAGLFLGSTSQSEGAFFGLIGDKPVEGIPHAWVQQKGSDVLRYARYIQSLKLRNITAHDVLAPHFKTRGHTHNTLPPKVYWRNIAPTLRLVDAIIDSLHQPLDDITSAYRSPRYNRAVGGRSHSYHMRNVACDIQIQGVSPSRVAYAASKLRSRGYFKGGIGRYSNFVHVDTRGVNVNWRG